MAQQTILMHFDSRSDAQKATDALVQAGISRGSIRMLPEAETTGYKRTSTTSSYDHKKDEGGFLASLGDMFLPDEDRYAYAEGMSRGGVTLAVTARGRSTACGSPSATAPRHGRARGDLAARGLDRLHGRLTSDRWNADTHRSCDRRDGNHAQAGRGGDPDRRGEPAGRQAPGRGRVRIRSYVVETPVQEQVNLRQEHVQVERRPVDRP